jgi:DNA modification methylase
MKLLLAAPVRQQMTELDRPELQLSREELVDQSRPWPADRVEHWPLDRLVPYARNARTHSEEQVAQIAASMREWGWTNPVLVDEVGMIIAGHGRMAAARQLGWTEAPVMVAKGWSDAQKRAYVIADNKLALSAGWDDELLRLELKDLDDLGADLSLLGFTENELAQAMNGDIRRGLTDEDAAPPLPETPVSRVGDTWVIGAHRVRCGDATSAEDVGLLLGRQRPLLMVTDPPYGVAYDPTWRHRLGVSGSKRTGKVLNDDRADWREAWGLFPGDVAYVWHGALHATTVAESLVATGFTIRSQIIWAKQRLVIGRGDYHWQHEPCWYAVRKKGHWAGDRKQTTLWQIASRDQDAETFHGTQKPVECMRRPILNNSSPGQSVYEPFLGSGTTVIAAETVGRACLAMELSPAYVDVAVRRWQAFTGEKARLEETNAAFEDVVAERQHDGSVEAGDIGARDDAR